jgi:hypothetical protein
MHQVNVPNEWKVTGALLDTFNALETKLSLIIADFVRPPKDRFAFLQRQVLHNSSVTFGGKVKLVLAIARSTKGPKLKREDFHRMLHIRNALAHGDTTALTRKNVNALLPFPIGEYLVIETLKGDGTVEEKLRGPAIAEFMMIFNRIWPQVIALHEKVKQA